MGDDERQRVRLRDILRIDVPKLHAANTNAGVDATPAARIIMRILEEPRGRYMTRVLYCPPLPLLWGFRPSDGTRASVVHQAYLRALWNERGFAGRLGLLAHFLVWPPIVFGTMAWFTALNGRAVCRRSGKGVFRQLREQLMLAARHAILPPWYYMFELFDDVRLERAGQYLRRDETKGGIYRLLGKRSSKLVLRDKVHFANCCHEYGVRTPDYLEANEGSVRRPDKQAADSLPKADLFAKPARGRGGRGAEEWRYDGSGWSRGGAPPIDEAALLEHFRALSKAETLSDPAAARPPLRPCGPERRHPHDDPDGDDPRRGRRLRGHARGLPDAERPRCEGRQLPRGRARREGRHRDRRARAGQRHRPAPELGLARDPP